MFSRCFFSLLAGFLPVFFNTNSRLSFTLLKLHLHNTRTKQLGWEHKLTHYNPLIDIFLIYINIHIYIYRYTHIYTQTHGHMLIYIHIPSPGTFIYQSVISQKLSLKYIYHLWQQRAHKVPGQEHWLRKNESFFLPSKMFFLPEKAKKNFCQ